MQDRLKLFIDEHRVQFDSALPPAEAWANIVSGIESRAGEAHHLRWLRKLKFWGITASIMAIGIYFLSEYEEPGNEHEIYNEPTTDTVQTDAIEVTEPENATTPEVEQNNMSDSVMEQEAIRKDEITSDVDSKVSVMEESAVHKNLRSSIDKDKLGVRYRRPDKITEAYNTMTKSSKRFYSTKSNNIISPLILLTKNTTPVHLPSGSHVIVEFTCNDIVDGSVAPEIMIEANGFGSADIYVSSDNKDYYFLGIATWRNMNRYDLKDIDFKGPVRFVKVVGREAGKSIGFELLSIYGLPEKKE